MKKLLVFFGVFTLCYAAHATAKFQFNGDVKTRSEVTSVVMASIGVKVSGQLADGTKTSCLVRDSLLNDKNLQGLQFARLMAPSNSVDHVILDCELEGPLDLNGTADYIDIYFE